MARPAAAEFLRFLLVGGLAFALDAGLLELLVTSGSPPLTARILSIALALQCSYVLHARFTYRPRSRLNVRSWAQFMASNLIGAALNYGVFAVALMGAALQPPSANRLVAVIAGTAAGLVFNHWANRRFAFRDMP